MYTLQVKCTLSVSNVANFLIRRESAENKQFRILFLEAMIYCYFEIIKYLTIFKNIFFI